MSTVSTVSAVYSKVLPTSLMVSFRGETQVFFYKGMFFQLTMKVMEVKYSEPTLFQSQGRSKNGIFLDLVLDKGGNPEY